MSYILEALKKSEQDRQRGQVPSLQSSHITPVHVDKKPRTSIPWVYVVSALLLVNGLILGYFFLLPESAQTKVESVSNEQISDAPPLNASTTNVTPSNPAAVAGLNNERTKRHSLRPESAAATNAPRETSATREDKGSSKVIFLEEPIEDVTSTAQNASGSLGENDPRSAANSEALNISELPENIQKAIPAIVFAGHVYSKKPANRSVMINGNKMREGQSVTSTLLLDKITKSGAEFTFRGFRFKLGALQDWSYK